MKSVHDELAELHATAKRTYTQFQVNGQHISELKTVVYEAERVLQGCNDHKKAAMIHVIKDCLQEIRTELGSNVDVFA